LPVLRDGNDAPSYLKLKRRSKHVSIPDKMIIVGRSEEVPQVKLEFVFACIYIIGNVVCNLLSSSPEIDSWKWIVFGRVFQKGQ